ncbi:MAG: serine hydrolase domain-containing protein [Candidatus Acidiferrales bacterium]|jgi:D-alanyl-D-alanine carboxypeptidase
MPQSKNNPRMRVNQYALIIFAIILAALAKPASLAAQTSAGPLDAAEEAKISKMLAASGVPSISIAIVDENGKTVYARAFGQASLSPERAASEKTRYAIGSISKQFTVAAILLLAEERKLSLDDTVSKYFPQYTRANEITIRQLLSHTSGYEDYAPQDYMIPEWLKPTTPDAVLNQWATKPLNFDPGTKWQYSNTNYVLAGRIAEKASGMELMKILQQRIFTPLKMSSAGDCSVDKTPEDAVAYTRYGLGPARPALREAAGWYFAAGELCMTPADLARWNISFLHKQILKPASYEEFTREVLLKNGNHTHYALGISLGELDNIPWLSHGGEVSGFLATNTVYPTRGAAVTVLSNQDDISLIGPVSREISRYLLEPDTRAAADTGTPEELQQVRGIIEGLQQGKIDRSLFTSNCNFYFSDEAMQDIQSSLSALGTVKEVKRTRQSLRGGMTFRHYHVEFEKKSLVITVYLTPDQHYEQFLPIEEF